MQRESSKRKQGEAQISQLAAVVEDLKLHQEAERAAASEGHADSPEVELLKLKVAAFEEAARGDRLKFGEMTEQIETLVAGSSHMSQRVRDEIARLGNSLQDRFVDGDAFAALRSELDLIKESAATSVQASAEEREASKAELDQIQRALAEIRAGTGEAEVITSRGNVKTTSDDYRQLEQRLQGIDSKIQRDIRKVKSRLRGIERAIEDVQAEATAVPLPVTVAAVVATGEKGPGTEERLQPVVQTVQTEAIRTFRAQVGVIQGDFNLLFVMMFALLLYFLVVDLL
jgi:tetrahydromethanopterin S-methyltransferase subunit G